MLAPNGEEVVWIEYHDGRPFAVVTGDERGMSTWDFEFCKAEGRHYYHRSGGGPAWSGCVVNAFSEPDPPPGQLWRKAGVPLCANDGKRTPLTDADCLAMGLVVIAEPLDVGGCQGNPFEVAEEGRTVYCEFCEDNVLSDGYDDPCEHITWCEECGWWVYEDVHHRRVGMGDAEPTVHKGVKHED